MWAVGHLATDAHRALADAGQETAGRGQFPRLVVFFARGAKYVTDVEQAPLLATGSGRERATSVSRAWLGR